MHLTTRHPLYMRGELNYKGLDGVGFVTIPPELVGHPALTPYVPPASIENIQAMIAIVDRYNGVI